MMRVSQRADEDDRRMTPEDYWGAFMLVVAIGCVVALLLLL